MKKRFITVLLSVALVLNLLAGCSQNNNSADPDQSKDTAVDYSSIGGEDINLTVYTYQYADGEVETLNTIIDLFEDKYPNVKVEMINTQDYETAYKLAFDSDEGPDLVYVDDAMQVLLEKYGYLADISDMVSYYGWDQVISASALNYQNSRHPGAYYSVPYASNPRVMWYNKNIYDQLGLSVPTTVAELEANCEVIKAAGYTPFEASTKSLLWYIDELLFNEVSFDDLSAWYYLEDTTDAMRTARIDAMEKVEDWIKKGYFRDEILSITDDDTAFVAFAGMDCAMFYGAADMAPYFDLVEGWNIDAFAFPANNAGDSKIIVNATNGGWAVNAQIDPAKKAAAAAFINMFFTEEVNQLWVEAGYSSCLSYDISSANVNAQTKLAAAAAKDTEIGFFMDNAVPGLLDTMIKLNEQLISGKISGSTYAQELEAKYEELKAEQ